MEGKKYLNLKDCCTNGGEVIVKVNVNETSLRLTQGDITRQETAAIVNAAN